MLANERMDERVTQYLRLDFCLFQTIVPRDPPTDSHDDFLKLWVSDSIVAAVVNIYLKLFHHLVEDTDEFPCDIANEFFGFVLFWGGGSFLCV